MVFLPPTILKPEISIVEAVHRKLFPSATNPKNGDRYYLEQIKLSENQKDYPCFKYSSKSKTIKKFEINKTVSGLNILRDIWMYENSKEIVFWNRNKYKFIIWNKKSFYKVRNDTEYVNWLLEENLHQPIIKLLKANTSLKNVGESDTYGLIANELIRENSIDLRVFLQSIILIFDVFIALQFLEVMFGGMDFKSDKTDHSDYSRGFAELYRSIWIYGNAIEPEAFVVPKVELISELSKSNTKLPKELLNIIAKYVGNGCFKSKWGKIKSCIGWY